MILERHLRLLRTAAALSFKSSLVYRFDALFALLTSPLYLLAQWVVWREVFRTSGQATLGGFDFKSMFSYLAISYLTTSLTWDRATDLLKTEIRDGSFVVYLLRPFSFLHFGLLAKLGDRGMALVFEVLPVALVLGLFFGFDLFHCRDWAAFLAALVLAFFISYLIAVLLGMLAFWIVRPDGVIWIYATFARFLNGTWLPLSIFPAAVQPFFLLLPFQFIAFVPARLFTGEYELAGVQMASTTVLAYGVAQASILFCLTLFMWRISVRRFCGVGT